MLQGLIMDMPLMISSAIQHAAAVHGGTEIVARDIDGTIHRYTYAEAHRRAKRLANALGRLGVRQGDRIGTFGWNTHRHFELFYGVSGSGAVLHPVNPRLFADQIVYIVNHAEDAWLFIDAATLSFAEQLAPRLKSVKGFVLMAERSAAPKGSKGPQLRSWN
jgi:fatty-acyl-CoA synthase